MTHEEYANELRKSGTAMGRTIASLLQMKPFRPFVINLTSRTSYEIADPNTIEVRDGVAEIRTGKDGRAIISLSHVCSVSVAIPKADEPVIVKSEPASR